MKSAVYLVIRKLAVGACSVLIGVSFLGAPSVLAEEEGRAVTEEEDDSHKGGVRGDEWRSWDK